MKTYLVGGAIRDKLLGLPIKERDWVVVGATVSDMLKLGYQQVGKEFPVFLHPKTREEYALARMERKVQAGYKGFTVDTAPTVTLEADLIRRDLTINAMAETENGQLIDPYGGEKDLKNKVLRHVSPAFSEDPVRILRVGRFMARFAYLGFQVASETIDLMREMVKAGEVNALVAERVWKELERALGEPNPEQFFTVLQTCGAMEILFPQLLSQPTALPALQVAAQMQAKPIQRFAALLHALPTQEITQLCSRYRVPNDYKELASLAALHHITALQAKQLSAEQLLSLFSATDVFRRRDRFADFLSVCTAIAQVKHQPFDSRWLFKCAQVAFNYDVKELIAQGFTGADLAEQIKKKRLEKIAAWLVN